MQQSEALPMTQRRVVARPGEVHQIELATMSSPPLPPDIAETRVDSVSSASSILATSITVQEPPAQETPAQETPAQETPAQETSAQETPAQETPAQETPAQGTPAQETPAGSNLPAISGPTTTSPIQTATSRRRWWRPRQTKPLWLSALFIVTMSQIIAILVLYFVSNENQGFTPLWNPPDFLARLPAFENNIWSQGVLYTSLPAFFMTLYTMMFSSTVTCFTDLQPYIDLAKTEGATARTTIMLDYRRHVIFEIAYVAIRNHHFLLAFYIGLSTALTIAVVPLTAFLFVSSPVNIETTAPISFTTGFNELSILALPDFELALEFATAFRIYDAGPPPWTDGEYAFPEVLLQNTDTETFAGSNLTVETTGHSAYIDCRIIPEEEYNLTMVDPIGYNIPATIFEISAIDRGCAISSNFITQPGSSLPGVETNMPIISSWMTPDCTPATRYSRMSIASGLYVNSLTNFSLVSCIPSYWTTPGTLTLTLTSLTGLSSIKSFSANESNALQSRSVSVAIYFESSLQNIGCVNPTSTISASTFLYGRQIYALASKTHPESPLLPEAISYAAQTLFTSIYAVLVSTSMFQPISPVINSIGVKTTTVTKILVVDPIAYTIIAILFGVLLAIGTMFWYGQKPNVLDAEPIGLLSSAFLLQRSNLTQLINEIQEAPEYDGKLIEGLQRKGIGPDARVRVESYSPLRVIVSTSDQSSGSST